ncbi:MAG: site-specific DNA-methyltransferase [Clostridia bacterium]|nr:site-specific DNA-methyltransferase [Clostridia bacterium]
MKLEPIVISAETHRGANAEYGRFLQGDILRLLPALIEQYEGQVKLIYMDPPFQTGDKFTMRVRVGEEDWRRGRGSLTLPAFSDTLSREEYYDMMRQVLIGCKALLRDDGMLFLHVDYRTSARLRLLLDEVFGEENFLNEIIWAYQTGGRTRRYFSRKHDVIFFYRKTDRYDFNLEEVMVKPDAPKNNHMKRHVDPDGRVYRSMKVGGKVYTYYDDDPVAPSDVWNDLSHLQQRDPERTGYDMQKPLSLLIRIVRCGSRADELVFDPFCGSGTALAAAQYTGRRFLGVDQSPLVPNILRRRLMQFSYEMALQPSPNAPECDANLSAGVGFYEIQLNGVQFPEGSLPPSVSQWDAIDAWAAGYIVDGAFQCAAEARRSQRAPQLLNRLNVPVYSGQLALAIYDVMGGQHYYQIRPSEFNLS